MTKFYTNAHTPGVFYKVMNASEILKVVRQNKRIGIEVISADGFFGDLEEINKEEFTEVYSEVKKEFLSQNILQEEDKDIDLSEKFTQWADSYFTGNPKAEFIKEEVFTSMKEFSPKILGLFTSNMFKKQLRSWCSHNGYEFQDRILKLVHGKTTEHIKVTPLH